MKMQVLMLHTGSMIAQKVKIIPGKTFRFPLAVTKCYNADYDGEMFISNKMN
jgi:DNA-directed RNA polymerase beta' subunit